MIGVAAAVLALALAVLAPPPSAAAQDAADPRAPGRANAQAFRALPAEASMRVRAYDDTRDARRLKQQIERAVERKGRRVDDRAGVLTLNFDTAVQQIGRPGPPPGAGAIEADRDDSRVRLNLYGTNPDGAPGARRPEGGGSGSVQYQLTLNLDDPRGTRLWQGTATLLGSPHDEVAAYAAMARVLVEELGRTVRQKPFRIE